MIEVKEKTQTAINSVYIALDMERTKRRFKNDVQVRAAIAVSLKKHLKMKDAAEAIGIDRTTILHHSKKHADNMIYWSGYSEKYNVAEGIIDGVIEDRVKLAKLENIDLQMSILCERMQDLRDLKKRL
jgi:ribosomal protein L28